MKHEPKSLDVMVADASVVITHGRSATEITNDVVHIIFPKLRKHKKESSLQRCQSKPLLLCIPRTILFADVATDIYKKNNC